MFRPTRKQGITIVVVAMLVATGLSIASSGALAQQGTSDQQRTNALSSGPAAGDVQPHLRGTAVFQQQGGMNTSFGEVPVGESSEPGVLFIEGLGNAPSTVTDLSLSGDTENFEVTRIGPETPITLQPGEQVGVYRVTFTPTSEGVKSLTLNAESDAPDTPITISGTGVTPDQETATPTPTPEEMTETTTTTDTTTTTETTDTTAAPTEEEPDDGKAKQPSDGDDEAADGGNGKAKMGDGGDGDDTADGGDGDDTADGGNGKAKAD